MRRMLQRLLVMISAVVWFSLLFGCGQARREQELISLRAPEEKRVPSTLEPGLLAPTIVQANRDFNIEFTTFGGGCDRKGDEDVIVSERAATVKVYDFRRSVAIYENFYAKGDKNVSLAYALDQPSSLFAPGRTRCASRAAGLNPSRPICQRWTVQL
jgi:hypothetical protein